MKTISKNQAIRTVLITVLLLISLIVLAPQTLLRTNLTMIANAQTQVQPSTQANDNWTLVTDSRPIKAYANLIEYIWQKNATMAPNDPYDKIGLHRLVKAGITTKGAVFLLAGIYGSGEQLISNPSTSNYIVDESSNSAVYWANRGFDVYSIDYRAHFIPSTMNTTQASTIAANWGWDVYINDLKEGVDKAKTVSGFTKIYLAGMSFGGSVAMYYASEYWKQDLRGMILLDGGEDTIKFTNTTNTSNVTSSLIGLGKSGGLALEYPRTPGPSPYPSGIIFAYQNAITNPGAPAEWPIGTPLQPTINPLTNKPWTNITEWFAYQWYSTNYCNVYGGYGNVTVNIQRSAGADRYFPMRLLVETSAIHDWNSCLFVAYDFDDHYKEINVPVLGFRSGLYGIPTWGNFTNNLATSDFSQITLPNYGHLDVFSGPYSAIDVSQPAYQWMVNHLPDPLVPVVMPYYLSVSAGATATFTVTVSGGVPPYTYQWYQGSNLIAGQNSFQVSLPTTANNAGSRFSYYCQVTDSEKTNSSSNAVTLVVAALPTSTPVSTKQPAPTVSPTPTTTPTPKAPTPSSTSPATSTSTAAPVQSMSPAMTIAAIVIAVTLILVATIAIIFKRHSE